MISRLETSSTVQHETTASGQLERSGPTENEMRIGDVAKRAVLGFVVLTSSLSLLGALAVLFAFDGTIGTAESDFVGWIAEHRIGILDSAATIGSTLSDTWTVIGVLTGAATMLWAAGYVRHAATVVLAVLLEFTTFLAVGAIIGRARPDVETLHSVPSTPSFPSGHAAAAFVLYGALVLIARSLPTRSVPRLLWLLPAVIGLAVAAARVYEGVHHPIDVLAGLMLGVGALTAAGVATGLVDLRGRTLRRG